MLAGWYVKMNTMPKRKTTCYDPATGYARYAAHYDEKTNYLNSFEQGKLMPLLGDLKNKSVLEVGAGSGRLALQLQRQGAKVTALDVSAEMLAILKAKNSAIATRVAEAEYLPFADKTFEIVLAAFLIVHLKDPRRFFEQAHRVLKPAGKLIVTNINQKRPPELKTRAGAITIQSYYHRPEAVLEQLESLAFEIKENILVKEKEVWINQIILAEK